MAAMEKQNQNVKDIVLPHSQAKLDLYENYLLNYLRVLGLTPYVTKINLYDIYCGIGVYKDGNIGSPLITNKSIKAINNEYYNKDADEMLQIASKKINSYGPKERSLVFIDPYGYSQIHSEKIYNLIKNEHTEIILFLPVMQMYRFKDIALNDPDRACYEDLRKFILSFFSSNHRIHNDKIDSVFEFINEIKTALSYNDQFYTCSHFIERGKGNYYALFFITSNIYGLDKMVEAKWKLNPVTGKGFLQKKAPTLFDTHFEQVDHSREINYLKSQILYALHQKVLSNVEIYELTLRNEFRQTHAKTALDELIKEKKVDLRNKNGEYLAHNGAYYLDYDHFKNKDCKVYFKLI